MNNITMYSAASQRNETFGEFCINFCSANEPVRQFYNAYAIQESALQKGEPLNALLKLHYPISTLFGRSVSMQPYFFGVEVENDTMYHDEAASEKNYDDFLAQNDTASNETEFIRLKDDVLSGVESARLSNMKMVRMISMQFRAEHREEWTDDDVKRWEMDVVDFFQNKYKGNYLKVYVYSTTYVEDEMVRAGILLLPYLTVGFIIMCGCSVVTVMCRAAYMHQGNIFKALLAVMACVTPLLACCTALALLFTIGMRFSSILCVIPFLVLSIGVDSSYLMIHEWQRVTKEIREKHKVSHSVGHRMSEVLSEVGPAILISAITNILADGVGCWTSSPEIRLLCIGNLFSMFVAYLYQMSFYSGLMSLVGKLEIEAESNEDNITDIAIQGAKVSIRKYSDVVRKKSKFHDTSKLYISKYMKAYVNFVVNPLISATIISIYVAYIILSIWGITRINISLTSQKLFALDSPLIELENLRLEYQVPMYTVVTVFVQNPGDLSQPTHLRLMNSMVEDFESVEGSWGPVGTMYFVRDFITFEQTIRSEADYDYEMSGTTTLTPSKSLEFRNDELPAFLIWPEYDYWNGFIQMQNSTSGEKVLKRFFFTTAYHDERLKLWVRRGDFLRKWRAIVDKPIYKVFQAVVFHEDAIYQDLIENMPTDTWQSVLGTLVCMAGVCFVFLRSPTTVVIATACVLSICIGILGILSWWHVDLDPITMAAMIISIGFSVDIPAHVSYHYYQACASGPSAPPQARLGNCLTSVAFPALQAALSTVLCVCSLLFVKIYMSQVFVKTMVLCVFLCNVHGLIFLPAFLSTVDKITANLKRRKTYNTAAERTVQRRMNKAKRKTWNASKENASQMPSQTDRPPIPEFPEY